MGRTEFVDTARAVLQPAMTARDFGDGGPGYDLDGGGTVLYCTGLQQFRKRWPAAFAAITVRMDLPTGPGTCLDLVVEASPDGIVECVELESVPIDRLLRRTGHPASADDCTADALATSDTDTAIRVIRSAVETLLPLGPDR